MNDIKQGEVNILKHLVGIGKKTKKAQESINGHISLHNDLKSTASSARLSSTCHVRSTLPVSSAIAS